MRVALGYNLPSYTAAELKLVRALGGSVEEVLLPSAGFKLSFGESNLAGISRELSRRVTVRCLHKSNSEELGGSLLLGRTDFPLAGLRNCYGVVESYGGFDLSVPLRFSSCVFPKSLFSLNFNRRVVPKFVPPRNFVGPLYLQEREVTAPFRDNRAKVGVFLKNVFLHRKKVAQWRNKDEAEKFFTTHNRLTQEILSHFPDALIFAHPNHGGFQLEELELYKNMGLRPENYVTTRDYGAIDVGIGFSSHVRADLNWLGRPFIEITDMENPEKWTGRGVMSGFLCKGKKQGGLCTKSKNFPFFYGGMSCVKGLLPSVCELAAHFSFSQCRDVGAALLGPERTFTAIARDILQQ